MSCDEVISSLRGKVLKRPAKRVGKVLVKEPLPEESNKSDSFEGTMLLLDIVREKNLKEVQRKKEEMIRAMAMEQKKKNEMKGQIRSGYIHSPEISNINHHVVI